MTKYCASCKYYKHDTNAKPHPDRCLAYLDEKGNPQPCAVARSLEGECGNDAKTWEAA